MRLPGIICAVASLQLAACAASEKRLVLSDEMRPISPMAPAGSGTVVAKASGNAAANGLAPSDGYVMRLAENGRVWELQLPRDGGGYEVRVPLGDTRVPEALTQADRTMLSDKRPDGSGNESKSSAVDLPQAPQQSLLVGLAKISELYRQHRYELALIEAVGLAREYPEEARLHAMTGSLYRHLGKLELARASYQKALALDPSDMTIAEALRELSDQGTR